MLYQLLTKSLTKYHPPHAVQADSASFIADSFISSSAARQGFSSTTSTFNGNRIISQEQLPSMFSSSFNPGTSGSLVRFYRKSILS